MEEKEITPEGLYKLIEEGSFDFKKCDGALIFIGKGSEAMCQTLQGNRLNLMATMIHAMNKDKDLREILFDSVRIYKKYLKRSRPSLWQRFLNLFKKSESSEE